MDSLFPEPLDKQKGHKKTPKELISFSSQDNSLGSKITMMDFFDLMKKENEQNLAKINDHVKLQNDRITDGFEKIGQIFEKVGSNLVDKITESHNNQNSYLEEKHKILINSLNHKLSQEKSSKKKQQVNKIKKEEGKTIMLI